MLNEENVVRYITWSRWTDPMGRNQDSFEYIPEKDVKEFDNDHNNIFDSEDDEDDDEQPRPVIVTPLAVIPLKPFNNPTKVFNFWLGETTFTLSTEVAQIINDVPGVEILDIFTRYKFRIAVGGNFKFQDVRQAIEKSLDAVPPAKTQESQGGEASNMELDEDSQTKVKEIIKLKLSKFPYWAVYVCPNGEIDFTSSQEKNQDFEKKIEVYNNAKKLAGGAIFKYNEQIS